jgi:hypothetical protein
MSMGVDVLLHVVRQDSGGGGIMTMRDVDHGKGRKGRVRPRHQAPAVIDAAKGAPISTLSLALDNFNACRQAFPDTRRAGDPQKPAGAFVGRTLRAVLLSTVPLLCVGHVHKRRQHDASGHEHHDEPYSTNSKPSHRVFLSALEPESDQHRIKVVRLLERCLGKECTKALRIANSVDERNGEMLDRASNKFPSRQEKRWEIVERVLASAVARFQEFTSPRSDFAAAEQACGLANVARGAAESLTKTSVEIR